MAFNSNSSAHRRSNPFARTPSASPAPTTTNGRPKSSIFPSTSSVPAASTTPPHSRTKSNGSFPGFPALSSAITRLHRSESKSRGPASGTFAPSFIKTEEMNRSPDAVKGIEGENDFSGKRYVWVKDPQTGFVRGWVVEDLEGNRLLVQCDDGSVSITIVDMELETNTAVATRGRFRQRRQGQPRQVRQG
jgi:myosin protein heavy chain